MNLLEYEAKSILRKFNIPTPSGAVIRSDSKPPGSPVVLKSQVHSGGRGKAGGVRLAKSDDEVAKTLSDIFRLAIKGEKPRSILAEEVLEINREIYVSLVINRSDSSIELVANRDGGVEVESQTDFGRWEVSDGNQETVGRKLAEYLDLPEQEFVLQDLVKNLYECFVKEDMILLEINPLVLTADSKLVAGDAKVTLDDDAKFRHDDWIFEQTSAGSNFVSLDRQGTVATIANGAGLAMATVDAVHARGLKPANFLDIGGGATVDSVVASFKQLSGFPQLTAIVINIFGGIVRCDDVARAIIEARKQFDNLPTLYIRLSGNRAKEAAELLASESITLYPTLSDALREISNA